MRTGRRGPLLDSELLNAAYQILRFVNLPDEDESLNKFADRL
jgi:hypothetical protein